MKEQFCPNINTCRMVSTEIVVPEKDKKERYMQGWCLQGEEMWSNCKRYETKKALGFCPDFVVPDTGLSMDEIIDKFEDNTD